MRVLCADCVEVFVGWRRDGRVELSHKRHQVLVTIARVVDHCIILNHERNREWFYNDEPLEKGSRPIYSSGHRSH